MNVVILAAGMGTRLGMPHPKPLTPLADGRSIKGFLVEPAAINGARDISSFGGWRAFMAEKV